MESFPGVIPLAWLAWTALVWWVNRSYEPGRRLGGSLTGEPSWGSRSPRSQSRSASGSSCGRSGHVTTSSGARTCSLIGGSTVGFSSSTARSWRPLSFMAAWRSGRQRALWAMPGQGRSARPWIHRLHPAAPSAPESLRGSAANFLACSIVVLGGFGLAASHIEILDRTPSGPQTDFPLTLAKAAEFDDYPAFWLGESHDGLPRYALRTMNTNSPAA